MYPAPNAPAGLSSRTMSNTCDWNGGYADKKWEEKVEVECAYESDFEMFTAAPYNSSSNS
jgi:hypothetical protein